MFIFSHFLFVKCSLFDLIDTVIDESKYLPTDSGVEASNISIINCISLPLSHVAEMQDYQFDYI